MNTPVATYDPESRALYIDLKQSEGSVKTEVLKEDEIFVAVDYSESGEVVGVEVIYFDSDHKEALIA